MITLFTGLIASMAHVVTGPDHLAAVTPLAIDSRGKSWFVGLSWGFGHTIGMLLIGLLFILFRELIPVEKLSRHSDVIVGFLLIGVGSWALIRIYIRHHHGHHPHAHFHTKPFLYAHFHSHSHDELAGHEHEHDHSVRQNVLTALFIGIVHGFSGFSHLIALLPSLALPSVMDSVIYISAFAAGTIITMILFAFILGFVAFQSLIRRKQDFLRWFTIAGGCSAVLIGIVWIVKGL